jgi:hypothetical protein
MNKEVRANVRREWRWYAAAAWAQVATSVGISVYLFLRYGLHDSESLEALLFVDGFFVAYAFFIIVYKEDRPHAWLLSAARFGFASWFMMFLSSAHPVTEATDDFSPLGMASLGLAVVWVAAMVVAARAKGRAMDGIDLPEMLDADLAVKFDVRDNASVFTVDNTMVMLLWRRKSGDGPERATSACSLGDIRNLRTTYLRRPRTVSMPDDARNRYQLSVGPALTFNTPGGKWIVSTNRAQDAYDAIKDKRAKFRGSAPGLPLGPFLPKDL